MIRRVSSRQRLVSWDAFDATANHAEATSSSSSSEEEDYHCSSNESPTSRKRERPSKTKSMVQPFNSSSSPNSSRTTNNVPAFPWEFAAASLQQQQQQQQQIPMDGLPEDVFVYACTFLDMQGVRSLMATNHKFRHLLQAADSLWRMECQKLWKGLLPLADCNVQLQDATMIPTVVTGTQCNSMTANLPLLISMTPEHLPTKVDETMLGKCRRVHRTFHRMDHATMRVRILERQFTPPEQEELVACTLQDGRRSIQYTGRVGAGDRCIRSNHPLPRPTRRIAQAKTTNASSIFDMWCRSSSNNAIQASSCLNVWRPFVAPYVGTGGRSLQVGPRMVAYFEVSILEKPNNTDTTDNPNANTPNAPKRDCVAVGVATESFSCQTRMPGWDSQSFGYHGDDGGTFHASGAMLERFGPCFGAGDTVGCGIDFVARGIFFTLNGKFLGYGWKQLDSEFLEHDLYGVVGIDTNDPVTVNYGAKPFHFDLGRFTSKHHDQLIAHQYQHKTPKTMLEDDDCNADSELADLPSYPEI